MSCFLNHGLYTANRSASSPRALRRRISDTGQVRPEYWDNIRLTGCGQVSSLTVSKTARHPQPISRDSQALAPIICSPSGA